MVDFHPSWVLVRFVSKRNDLAKRPLNSCAARSPDLPHPPSAHAAAGERAAEGLVEFIDNPKHRRSKLVRLTPKGDSRYRELNARLPSIASTMGVALSEADIRQDDRDCAADEQ